MISIQKLFLIFILLNHVMCSKSRRVFNPCLFNVFSKVYVSETVYFDLSRFASAQNSWNVSYTHDNYNEAILKFTFCQTYSRNGNLFCSDKSVYACVSAEENYVVKNAGSRISGPFYRNGELQILIDNGESFGNIKFSVLVKLKCSDIEEKLTFLSYRDYVVTVLWNTPIGCPIDESDIHNTCVKTSPKGVTYDLRPLRHTVYYYSQKTIDFCVNICGKKKKDECNTVCKYDKNGKNEKIIEYGSKSQIALTGPKDSDLKIDYLDASDGIRAEVHLKCDRGAEEPNVNRIAVNGHVDVYMNSIFACEPEHPHTVFQDEAKNSYNISSLYRNSQNYILKGPTEDLNYIFNLGGVVDHMPGIACEGTICLWDLRNNLSVSLGYAQLEPIATDNSILLKFAGGGKCGVESNVHRAVIELQCNDPGRDPELKFITHDCVHHITWDTLSACYYKYIKGSQCTVREGTYSHFYNLKPLYNQTHNYVAGSPTTEMFYINICGSIIGYCGAYESGVSVCWDNKALGHINTEPIYYNGGIEQKMTGEACRKNGPNSTVTIKFLCEMDVHAKDHNKIQLKHKDEFSCIFVFVMYTSTVCTSTLKNHTCMVTDHELGYEYNFNKLSRTNSNYIAKTTTKGSNATFLLNVCQPVISGPNVMCPYDAMACLFTQQNRYMSIGKMSDTSFQFNKEHRVELKYTEGALCEEDSDGSAYETNTVIEFICDYNAKNSVPIFDSKHNCIYRFKWFTPVVCPPDNHKPMQQTSEIHESSKEKSLSKDIQDHHLIKTEEKENKTPLDLTFDSNKSKTIVTSSEKEHMKSTYAYEESAPEHSVDYYISHALKLKNVPNCSVIDNHGERIDLSALMKKNWHVKLPSGKSIVFSVCRNLAFLKCNNNNNDNNGHTGACMNHSNIGVANNKLIYLPGQHGMTGKVFLNYTGGDACNSSHKYSTLLSFECGTEEEMPTFVTLTDDCQIVIKFVTPLVCVDFPNFRNVTTDCEYYFCPNRIEVFDSNTCLIHDVNFTSVMNLTIFKESSHEVRSLAGSVYMLELCRDATKMCNLSHICRKSEHGFVDYGNAPITTYSYAQNAVHILYLGEDCSLNDRFHASIWLKCNRTHSLSIPSIIKETECIVVFEWESEHFCYYPNMSTGALMLSDEIKENSTSSGSAGLLWIIISLLVLCIIAYAFGLWLMDRKNLRICDLLRHCTSTSPTTRIRYSRDSEEMSSIL